MDYQVNLGFFEGPLDLLFHLVKKNKLEINNISLAELTEQYLDYIRRMQERDLDFAGEFLVMAAQLMELKSRTLLPTQPNDVVDEQNSANELVNRLLEYKRFKEITTQLKEKEVIGGFYFTRNNDDLIEQIITELPEFNPLENVTLDDFRVAFIQALKDAEERRKSKDELENRPEIKAEEFNVSDKIFDIDAILDESPGGITFKQLFSDVTCRLEVVVTFLALLEMMKLKKIKVTQDRLYSDLKICR